MNNKNKVTENNQSEIRHNTHHWETNDENALINSFFHFPTNTCTNNI